MSHEESEAPQQDSQTTETATPTAPRKHPSKALGHGAFVTLAITYKGECCKVQTFQDVMDKADAIFRRRSEVTIEEGRFGTQLNFSAFRKTKWSNASPSPKHWGLQFDRWTSEDPNRYVVAAHMILAADYRDSAKDCAHPEHTKAGHICHALEVVSVGIPPELAGTLKERPMSRRKPKKTDPAKVGSEVAAAPTVEVEAAEPAAEPLGSPQPAEPFEEPPLPQRLEQELQQTASSVVNSGGTAVAAELVIRHLPSLRNLATPSVVHITPDGDVFIATDLKGDDAYRMFDLRSRGLGARRQTAGTATAAAPTPATYLSIPRMVGLFQKEGPDGITFTKACIRLGPWKLGEFHRGIEDFAKWQGAYHDCFRKDNLRKALREVNLDLHKATADGKVIMDEHGDLVWTVVPL